MNISTKTFEVNINGVKETIEYKSDLTFGEVQDILKQTYNAKNPLSPTFDGQLYQRLIMEYAIVKAPFDPKDYTKIYELPDDAVQEILLVLMEQFPLGRFLQSHSVMLKEMSLTNQKP
ncbi:hypothetical protein [Nitrosopumilus sp.]|uniref:hypothetical protein n=1 Tax=Nitrosopumilus sp. TaxID=2024843 RepID=UPI003D1156C5